MHQPAATPSALGDDRVDLVPGVDVLAGDVEGLADGPRVAEQADEALREVLGVRQRPQRRAVPVNRYLRAAAIRSTTVQPPGSGGLASS